MQYFEERVRLVYGMGYHIPYSIVYIVVRSIITVDC